MRLKKNTKPRTQDHVIIKTLSGSTQRITYARRFDEEKRFNGKYYDRRV